MKNYALFMTGLAAIALGSTQSVDASTEIALSFDLSSKPSISPHTASTKPVVLEFDLSAMEVASDRPDHTPSTPETHVTQNHDLNTATSDFFAGGSNSLVATAVGSAEGTRTPDGHRTHAYYGHVDPGNGVWNLGSFSYQHGARSPEDADERQLRRLQTQASVLQEKAVARGLKLTLEEKLNGIDLANQSPRAALDRGGYIDWLAQAHELGLDGSEAVLWARTRSFLDPDTQRWNAPGLGNNVNSISHDQERRRRAIARAIEAHQRRQEQAALPELSHEETANQPPLQKEAIARLFAQEVPHPSSPKSIHPSPIPVEPPPEPTAVDQILNLDLPEVTPPSATAVAADTL